MTENDGTTTTPTFEPLQIRMVTPGFPPARGGVEEHCHQLADRLTRGGDRVSVLTASRTGRPGLIHRDGVDVRTYRAWPATSMSISPRLTLAGLIQPARESDIVHVHSYHASAGFAAIAGVLRPVVFTPHYHGTGHSSLARRLHRGYALLGRAMFAAADAVICVSDAERRALVADFPSVADRITVIPNGVDRAAIRAAEPFPGQPPTALVVGRLEPYKHVDAVIAAMGALPAEAQLVVIGVGSEKTALARQIADLGLRNRVRLLGSVGTADLHRWLRTARVLVSLSEQEAFGMVPLEAATAGARVVLSAIPAHREITGRFLGDAAELIEPDTDPAPAIGRALNAPGRVTVDVPDWTDIARQTRAVYRGVLDRRATGSHPTKTQEWSMQ